MGAIRGFSPQQEKGHVCLERVQWLSDTTGGDEHPGLHLFNASDVFVVEFLSPKKGATDVDGHTNSAAPAASAGSGAYQVVRPGQDGSTPSPSSTTGASPAG